MKTRWLINLALLVALIGLAWTMRHEIRTSSYVPTLTDRRPPDLYHVRISRLGEPTILLAQDQSGWQLEAPMQVDADDARIQRLLGILDAPVIRSFPAESASLSQLDLLPPKLKLEVDGLELGIGGIDPLGQSRYVLSNGIVHLIQDRFYHLLIAPPIDYVSPKLLPRDLSPKFGRIGGVPLSKDALLELEGLTAERVERLASAPIGTQVELKASDGKTLRVLVSEDRRRWARTDQDLMYVLTDPPSLATDPDAIDPTPPEPLAPPSTASGAVSIAPPPSQASPPADLPAVLDGPVRTERVPFAEGFDPDEIVPGDTGLSEPPVVRLTPDGREIPVTPGLQDEGPVMPRPSIQEGSPYGFGEDPFAPDPESDTEDAPEGSR